MAAGSDAHGRGLCLCGHRFIGDPNLPLSPGGQWGDIGKKQDTLKMENVFMFYIFYDK